MTRLRFRTLWQLTAGVALVASLAALAPAATPDAELLRLKGHTGATLGAAFSPDGRFIATGAADRTAVLWDAAKGTAVRRFEGHANAVSSVAFSADGARLVTGSIDRTARVWDARTGALLAQLAGGHGQHVHAIAISPDGKRVLTGSCDNTAVLWDVDAEKPLDTFAQPGEVWAVGFAPDGKSFFVGNTGQRGRVGRCLRLYPAAGAQPPVDYQLPPVKGAAFVDGGKTLLVNAGSALWHVDVATGKMREAKRPGMGGPSMTNWAPAPDGRTCLMADMMSTQWVDAETAKPLAEFPAAFTEQVRALAISPDGKLGVIGGGGLGNPWDNGFKPPEETDVRVVRLTRREETPARPNSGPVVLRPPSLPPVKRTSPDGKRTLTTDAVRVVWADAATGAEIARVPRPREQNFPAFARDLGRVAFWTTAHQVLYADPAFPGALKPLFRADGFEVGSVRFAHDGQSLWVASAGPPDRVTAADAARYTRPNRPSEGEPAKVAAPDGKPYGIYRWDLSAGKWAQVDDTVKSPVHYFQTTPDRRVVLCITDGLPDVPPALHAWDGETDKPLWTAELAGTDPKEAGSRNAFYHKLVLHPDNTLGAWSFGKLAGVFDVRTGKTLVRLDRHKGVVHALAFDPDGRRVWTIAGDDAIRAYDVKTGDVLKTVSLNGLSASGARLILTPQRRVAELEGPLSRREERDLGD